MDVILRHLDQIIREKAHKELLGCEKLTYRQAWIVQLIVFGHSQKEIADILHLSQDTVDSHVKNIYRTLDISKQTELVAWYFLTLFTRVFNGRKNNEL